MIVINAHVVPELRRRHRPAQQQLLTWLGIAQGVSWRNTADVRGTFRRASVLNRERVVFDIGDHRLIVAVNYTAGLVDIKFFGTHAEYDRVDARTVSRY